MPNKLNLSLRLLRRLLTEGGPTLAAFLVGALGMAAGAVAGWVLLREALGPGGWKLAACLCASYVGGSVNFAAVAAVGGGARVAHGMQAVRQWCGGRTTCVCQDGRSESGSTARWGVA